MPLIPELTFVDGEYRPAVGSLATAAAPARAQQGIARGLAIASDTFGEVAEKVRRIEDNGSENRAFLAFQKARDDHDAFRLANPDEAAWESDLDKRLSAAQTEIGKLPMSPEARTEINGRVDLWSQQAKAGTVEASLKQKTARARQDLTNALERDRSAGDFGSARERLGRSVATGTLLPEEAEADLLDLEDAEKQWSREQTNKATLATITEDASAWLRENPPEKLPEGVDAATYANQQSFARGVLRGVTHDRTAIILDGMASGEVTTPEQVEELAEELRPTVVEELKGELAKRADLRERERRATPEYQNQTIGRATAMIRDWRRDEEGFDETYAQIYTMIAQVEDPGAKEALMDQLGEARDGQKRTLDTNLKLANEVLSDAYKAGRFGDVSLTGKATMKTRAALDDGLLTDTGKLMRLGFTEEQAAEISAEKLKPHERVELYRTMFSQRQGVDQTTPFERAAFLAVRDGNTEFEVDDPESQDEAITARTEADERLGAALLHMKQFARANPTASKREYEDEVYRIAG